MVYIYIEKLTEKVLCFGSVTALCDATGLKPDNLYTAFGRKKLTEFSTNEYRIIKTKIIRS